MYNEKAKKNIKNYPINSIIMKHLKTIKVAAISILLMASINACHKENDGDKIPYGVELITQPGDCECKQWKQFEQGDTVIYLFPEYAGDTVPNKGSFFLAYFKDTLLQWVTTTYSTPYGPVCNPPEILKSLEIPVTGLKVKTSADFYKSCNPQIRPDFTESYEVILTSFIIQKP